MTEPSPATSTSAVPNPQPKLLHLGCGLCAPPEWLNVDGSLNAWLAQHPRLKKAVTTLRLAPRSQTDIPWPTNVKVTDLRKPLPFANDSFGAVFSSHLVEHLHRAEALSLLKEAYRVLRPGGLCRTLVPDLRALVDEYLGLRATAGIESPEGDPGRRLVLRLLMCSEAPAGGGLLYRAYSAYTDLHQHKWMYDGPSLVKLMTDAGFTGCSERGFLDSTIPHLDKVEMPGRVLEGAGVIVEGSKPA